MRAWRTLIRVVRSVPASGLVEVVIPGWDPERVVSIALAQLPVELRNLEPNRRLHARVNIGAQSIDDLKFSDWEPR